MMTSEIFVLLVGGVLLLVVIADMVINSDAASGWMNSKMRSLLGGLGILAIIYGGFTYGTVNLPGQVERIDVGNMTNIQYPVERVQLISPLDRDVVSCRILSKGVYPERNEKDIWVVLKPSDGYYYPQSDETNTSYKRDGEWQVITRFGGDQGEQFDLIVYEADASASQFFSQTIADWKENESYPGLQVDQMPNGLNEVEHIQVTLKNNCRGAF